MKKATLCFLLRETDAGPEVLLVLKKKGFGQGKWVGAGGKVDNEPIEIAAEREVREEVGVDDIKIEEVAVLTFLFTDPKYRDWSQEVYVFVAKSWRGEPAESDEVRPQWYTYNNVPYDLMWADGQLWLPKVLAGEKLKAVITYSDSETIIGQEIVQW